MKIETVINFISNYHVQMIEWSLIAILTLVILWVINSVFLGGSGDSAASGSIQIEQLDQLEETLKSVLEKTTVGGVANKATVSLSTEPEGVDGSPAVESVDVASGEGSEEGAVAGEAGLAAAGVSGEELDALKAQVLERETTINELRDQLEKAGAGSDDEDLKIKLRLLEDKLAEYEIIEDDIADLSTYKEENARLKEELEKLKAGGAVEAPTTPADTEMPAANDEDLVQEFAEAVGDESDGEVAEAAAESSHESVSEEAPSESEVKQMSEDDLMSMASEALSEDAPVERPAQEKAVEEKKAENHFDEEPSAPVKKMTEDELMSMAHDAAGVEDAEESHQKAIDNVLEMDGLLDEAAGDEAPKENPQDLIDQLMSGEADGIEAAATNPQDLVDQLMTGGEAQEEPAEEVVSPAPDSEPVAADDILAEFALDEGGEAEPITRSMVDEIAASVLEDSEPATEPEAVEEQSLDDLVKELKDDEATAEGKGESSVEGVIDADKVLSEMAGLESVEAVEGSSLEDELDVEKMVAEANELTEES